MPMPCDNCVIGCDWLSVMCRLAPEELPKLRPDLILSKPVLPRAIEISNEKKRAKHRRYYEANKDKYREWNRGNTKRYRERHRDRRLETERNWRAVHRESIAETQRSWWERNKDRINAERREKRAEAKYREINGQHQAA